mmetsp:Transcript_32312/g.59236  ORF Transcript_32312/g.59236 Transcript_32312/m.59236 type:complete len:291 (+) Transcript_32312:368-1240(+)
MTTTRKVFRKHPFDSIVSMPPLPRTRVVRRRERTAVRKIHAESKRRTSIPERMRNVERRRAKSAPERRPRRKPRAIPPAPPRRRDWSDRYGTTAPCPSTVASAPRNPRRSNPSPPIPCRIESRIRRAASARRSFCGGCGPSCGRWSGGSGGTRRPRGEPRDARRGGTAGEDIGITRWMGEGWFDRKSTGGGTWPCSTNGGGNAGRGIRRITPPAIRTPSARRDSAAARRDVIRYEIAVWRSLTGEILRRIIRTMLQLTTKERSIMIARRNGAAMTPTWTWTSPCAWTILP